jgi:hypothetical protein
MNRNDLEELRTLKRARHFYRLESATIVEYEYQGLQWGHPSTYAFVRFECVPADDLSFDVRTSWPSEVDFNSRKILGLAVAEGVADILLDGLYQHSGCALNLVEVRFDEICSSEAAFMTAARNAMQQLLKAKWNCISRHENTSLF